MRLDDLNFRFCDSVMNHLSAYMMLKHKRVLPTYSLSVFLAFDEGEYRHSGDAAGSSAEQLYTKPMIAKILSSGPPVT